MAFLKNNKKIFLIIAAVLVIGFVYKLLFPSASTIQYITAVAKKGDIEASVLVNGTVKPYRLVPVGARATGRILRLKVKPGSIVHQGDLLAEIDPINQENMLKNKRAALKGMQAKLREQEARLALAQQKQKRLSALYNNNASSKETLENAKAQVQVLRAEIDYLKTAIEQTELDVANAEVDLGYTKITAPIDGTVLATLVQEGQNVNAVQSAPTIVILGDLTKMQIRVEISEADIVRVHAGQAAYFSVLGDSSRRYETRLEDVEPAPESIRKDISINPSGGSSSEAVYYNGTFTVPNPEGRLRTYMTAEVHIVLGQAKNVLLIPFQAIQSSEGGQAKVLVLKNGKPVERIIKTGLSNLNEIEVKSGLSEGEIVVISSIDLAQQASSSSQTVRHPRRF